jgi:hypothetical protein
VLGNDRGYDDDLHLISPVIVALRGNIALQRKKPKRSLEEVAISRHKNVKNEIMKPIDESETQQQRRESAPTYQC